MTRRSDATKPRLTEQLRGLLLKLYGGTNDELYGELDRIDAFAVSEIAATTPVCELEEARKILQKACDRDWKNETLYQTAVIASNAIYWRDREIDNLKRDRDARAREACTAEGRTGCSFAVSARVPSETLTETERAINERINLEDQASGKNNAAQRGT